MGSIAIALLARLGCTVTASTGRPEEAAHLQALGASGIVDRAALSGPGKPLQKENWAAAIDAVGSHTLANVMASTRYGGVVAACGLAQGMDLPATVAPFILRGVTLAGVDSVYAPQARRRAARQRLAAELPAEVIARNTCVVGLADALALADAHWHLVSTPPSAVTAHDKAWRYFAQGNTPSWRARKFGSTRAQ